MSKYGNRKVTIDGITFDSTVESRRYLQLKLLEAAGEIRDISCHRAFTLAPQEVDDYGKKIAAITYEADFVYLEIDTHVMVIEDVKGVQTAVFRLKWNLLRRHFNGDTDVRLAILKTSEV